MEILELIGVVVLKASVLSMVQSIEFGFVTFAAVIIFLAVSAYPFSILHVLLPHPVQVSHL
jgi:hypothetical protein